MRIEPTRLWDIWLAGGPFVDTTKPTTRMTVAAIPTGIVGFYQPWHMIPGTTGGSHGTYTFRGVFWDDMHFEGDDPDNPSDPRPIELEVPNLRSVRIEKQIDTGAAVLTVGMYNTDMGDVPNSRACYQIGNPGYYSWNWRETPESRARWGGEGPSPIGRLLRPNSLLRTYQGFGDQGSRSIQQQVDADELVLTGTWLIDTITIGTDGMLTIKARDLGKLVIEQKLYPPLIPADHYPLMYFTQATAADGTVTGGNLSDYSDILIQLLIWTGFGILTHAEPAVKGIIEAVGAPRGAPNPVSLGSEFFDKKPIIDVINAFREICGFFFWIDPDGSPHWQFPNWRWPPGNYTPDNTYVPFIPDLDEMLQLTDLSLVLDDKPARSGIAVQSVLAPTFPNGYRASSTEWLLNGIIELALWVNEHFNFGDTQRLGDLIDRYLARMVRQYSITCFANPLLDVNDQIRIFERQTSEIYLHWIKGFTTDHDLESGAYNMTLDTVWLGSDLAPTSDQAGSVPWVVSHEPEIVAAF